MPLPWNEIRDRAIGFARDWQDAAYGKKSFASDAERVAFLFGLCQRCASLLTSGTPPSGRKARVGARTRGPAGWGSEPKETAFESDPCVCLGTVPAKHLRPSQKTCSMNTLRNYPKMGL